MVRPHRDRVGGRVTRGSAVIRSRGLEGHTPLRHEARWEGDCEAEREQCAVAHQRISSLIQPLVTFFSPRSEEHTSELQSHSDLVCRLLLEKKKTKKKLQ